MTARVQAADGKAPVVVDPAALVPDRPALAVIPRHVALIMDGNGRWARERGLRRSDGHRAGAENIRPVLERCGEHGIGVVTLFGFSTENWGRPRPEVQALLRLSGDFIDRHLGELDEAGIQLRHLGDQGRLPAWLRRRVDRAVERTRHNERLVVNLAFNYGGRDDIVRAVRQLVAEGLHPDEVTEQSISDRVAASDLPEPDLLIRTGGEARISNFMVWQSAYAEYYFTETLWPDFGPGGLDAALLEFGRRQRRFGLVRDDDGADQD